MYQRLVEIQHERLALPRRCIMPQLVVKRRRGGRRNQPVQGSKWQEAGSCKSETNHPQPPRPQNGPHRRRQVTGWLADGWRAVARGWGEQLTTRSRPKTVGVTMVHSSRGRTNRLVRSAMRAHCPSCPALIRPRYTTLTRQTTSGTPPRHNPVANLLSPGCQAFPESSSSPWASLSSNIYNIKKYILSDNRI